MSVNRLARFSWLSCAVKQSVEVHIMNATMRYKQQRCAANKKNALQTKNERCKQKHAMHHGEHNWRMACVAIVSSVAMKPKIFEYFECSWHFKLRWPQGTRCKQKNEHWDKKGNHCNHARYGVIYSPKFDIFFSNSSSHLILHVRDSTLE